MNKLLNHHRQIADYPTLTFVLTPLKPCWQPAASILR